MPDKIKTKITATGVEIVAEGGAASRIGHSLADAIGPFTEALGSVGDQIQLFRIHKYERALKTLVRANEMRKEQELQSKPVSLKFLSRWIEGASLEEEDEILSELWARLLAGSPEKFETNQAVFVDILSKIGTLEANIFQEIIDNKSEADWEIEDAFNSFDTFKRDIEAIAKAHLKYVIPKPISLAELSNNSSKVIAEYRSAFSMPGSIVTECKLYCFDEDEQGENQFTISYDDGLYENYGESESLFSLDALSYFGLVETGAFRGNLPGYLSDSKFSIFLHGASITPLGYQFSQAVLNGEKG